MQNFTCSDAAVEAAQGIASTTARECLNMRQADESETHSTLNIWLTKQRRKVAIDFWVVCLLNILEKKTL